MRNVMEIINLVEVVILPRKIHIVYFNSVRNAYKNQLEKDTYLFPLAVSENIRINFRTVMNAVKRDIYTEFSNYVPSISSMTISSFCQYSLLFSS